MRKSSRRRKSRRPSSLYLSGLTLCSLSLILQGCAGATNSASTEIPTASITGSVSSLTSAALGNSLNLRVASWGSQARSVYPGFSASTETEACSSGSFTGAYVGEGGTQVASGSFSSGSFSVPAVPVGKELILTFTCASGSTQRCLVKAGDKGVSCNPVADAVMAAFESALGKSVMDRSLSGKSIAKVGSAIVQAAQSDSTAASAFNAQIEACKLDSTPTTCYLNTIRGSAFGGAFKMMSTMVQGWDVEALFTLLTDVFGAKIRIDDFIYTGFGSMLDTAFGTDFVASVRTFISNMVADQDIQGNAYVTKIECEMHYKKFRSGGRLRFPPTMVTVGGISRPVCKNDTFLAASGYSPTQISTINAAIDSGSNSELQLGTANCSSYNDPGINCARIPNMAISAKYTEANRNDPNGDQSNSDFSSEQELNLISVFPEVMQAVQAAVVTQPNLGGGGSAPCFSIASGPPVVDPAPACQLYFMNLLAGQKKNFSGLLGLYMYLKNPGAYSGGLSALSLGNLHSLFTRSNFLNMKLAVKSPQSCGAEITGGGYLPSLVDTSGSYYKEVSGLTCSSSGPSTIALSQATEKLALSAPSYESTFKGFETIPSAEQIQSFVFGSAYHSEWNPTGSQYYFGSSFKHATNNSDLPIFCKMVDKITQAPRESELDSKSLITCLNQSQLLAALGTTSWTNGTSRVPVGYPYSLISFGFQGDGKGGVFALADAKTGMQIRAGNQPVLVHQFSTSNNPGECQAPAEKNTVITERLNFGWGSKAQSQAVKAYCMDMTSFEQAGSLGFYFGGNLELKQKDSNGNSWTFYAAQVGAISTSSGATEAETTIPQPVCYFAAADSLTSGTGQDAGIALSGSDTINSSTGLLSLGGSSGLIDLCSASHSGKTKYYVIMSHPWNAANRSDLRANLISSESGASILQFRNWGSSGVWNYEDLLVKLSVSTIEGALGQYRVAPAAPSNPVLGMQLVNSKWNKKFDPFCDDRNGNGFCDCFIAGTQTLKANPSECTLEDDAAEPTLSNPPYWVSDPNASKYENLFNAMGGKSGSELASIPAGTLGTGVPAVPTAFSGDFLNNNQIRMDISRVFQCLHRVGSETTYRSPTMLVWQNFGSTHHQGCPASEGGSVVDGTWSPGDNDWTNGGPVRMIKPIPAKNTYAITRPNTLIKLINYATKSTGQGISLSRTEAKFGFDEALALLMLRASMPDLDQPVYSSSASSASDAFLLKGAQPYFTQVWLPSPPGSDNPRMDMVSTVLRALTHPDEL